LLSVTYNYSEDKEQNMTVQEQTKTQERWMSLTDASREIRMNINGLNRFITRHGVEVKRNPRDGRLRMVDVNKIKDILGE
jgi:hypothetical protein